MEDGADDLDEDDRDFVEEESDDFERPLDVGLANFDGSGLDDLEERIKAAIIIDRTSGSRLELLYLGVQRQPMQELIRFHLKPQKFGPHAYHTAQQGEPEYMPL